MDNDTQPKFLVASDGSATLSRLDAVDWASLSHAYGTASDVPDLIRGLASAGQETREQSLAELFSNIWHQGTVYEATAYAVPFLLGLAADQAIPDRDRILYLLQAIAEGWVDRHQHKPDQVKFVSPADADRDAREREHYRMSHERVADGLGGLSKLLSDDEPSVRMGAAFVLSTLAGRSTEVATALLDAMDDEREDSCLASLVLALSDLTQASDDPGLEDVAIRRCHTVFAESDSFVASLSAGIALLRMNQADVLPRVLQFARSHLVDDSEVFGSVAAWKHTGEFYSVIERSLHGMPEARLGWIIEGLSHFDADIRSIAMHHGCNFCEEYRDGPMRLAGYYVNLAASDNVQEGRIAMRRLRGLGAEGRRQLDAMTRHPQTGVRTVATEELTRAAGDDSLRESSIAERRPFPFLPVAALQSVIERHQTTRQPGSEQEIREAVIQLGFHGENAASAVEQLRQFTLGGSPRTRVHAIRALWRITNDHTSAIPLLQANLQPDWTAFLVVDCLAEIGAPARTVTPELRRIIDSKTRFFQNWHDTCATDEAFCKECTDAILAINAEPRDSS